MKRPEVDRSKEKALTTCRWGGGVQLGCLTVQLLVRWFCFAVRFGLQNTEALKVQKHAAQPPCLNRCAKTSPQQQSKLHYRKPCRQIEQARKSQKLQLVTSRTGIISRSTQATAATFGHHVMIVGSEQLSQ